MTYHVNCEDCAYEENATTRPEAIRLTREHRWTNYHRVAWSERKTGTTEAAREGGTPS